MKKHAFKGEVGDQPESELVTLLPLEEDCLVKDIVEQEAKIAYFAENMHKFNGGTVKATKVELTMPKPKQLCMPMSQRRIIQDFFLQQGPLTDQELILEIVKTAPSYENTLSCVVRMLIEHKRKIGTPCLPSWAEWFLVLCVKNEEPTIIRGHWYTSGWRLHESSFEPDKLFFGAFYLLSAKEK